MKRPRGGSPFLLLTPDELISRIATLVPPPRTHALRYHGLFAPNSKHRGSVVPAGGRLPSRADPTCAPPAPGRSPQTQPAPATSPAFELRPDPGPTDRPAPRYRVPWAELLRKVFSLDVLECPRCAGRLELIAFIAEPGVAKRILVHLGLPSQAPPLARARAPDDPAGQADDGPDYLAGDRGYQE